MTLVQFGEHGKVQMIGDMGPFSSVFVNPETEEMAYDRIIVKANNGEAKPQNLGNKDYIRWVCYEYNSQHCSFPYLVSVFSPFAYQKNFIVYREYHALYHNLILIFDYRQYFPDINISIFQNQMIIS